MEKKYSYVNMNGMKQIIDNDTLACGTSLLWDLAFNKNKLTKREQKIFSELHGIIAEVVNSKTITLHQ